MTLTLRIDNFDTLDDGGPTWITLDQRSACIGRRAAMDWVLPDPAKHISGHHFDIAFRDGGYWLTDVSTNGTYLQGSHHRIDGAQQLNGGERLIVGHYVISVELLGAAAPAPAPQPAPPPAEAWAAEPEESDPWDLSDTPLQPVNPLPGPAANPHHFDEVAQDFVPLQRPADPSPMQSGAAPVQQPGFAQGNAENVQQPPTHTPMSMPAVAPQMPPGGHPQATPAPPPPPAPAPAAPAAPPVAAPVPQPAPSPAPVHDGAGGTEAILAAFCRGANLPPEAAAGIDPVVLVEALGRSARISVDEIMRMLHDRVSVKKFTRGGDRTMQSAIGNNPMKFLPDSDQAFAAMFLQHREGFMQGPESFQNALGDLRRHQFAVFAALQPALADVLTGLSPDEIEGREATSANLLSGSKKGRNWEAYVQRWDDKASVGEHGMLDAFLRAFARAYADAANKNT